MNKTIKTTMYIGLGLIILAASIYGAQKNDPLTQMKEERPLVVDDTYQEVRPGFVIEDLISALHEGDLKASETALDTTLPTLSNTGDADRLVYFFAREMTTYGNYWMNMQPELFDYLRTNKLGPSQIPSQMKSGKTPEHIRAMWDNMNDEMILIELGIGERYVNENFTTRLVPNYKLILAKYGDFISPVMIDWLQMKEKTTWNYTVSHSGGAHSGTLENNLIAMMNFIQKHPESEFTKAVQRDYNLQLHVYLGYFNGSRVFNEVDLSLSDEWELAYESMAKKETVLSPIVEEFLSVIRENGNKMTEAVLYAMEDLAGTDGDSYFPYWHNILGVDVRFDGDGLVGTQEDALTETIDPETGKVIDVHREP